MTPGQLPLNLYHGDTYHWIIAVWLDAEKTEPADLTDVTPKAEIRDKSKGKNIVPLTCSITQPNLVNVALEADASSMLPSSGVWDLQLTWPSGDVSTILAGKVTVTGDVTDSYVNPAGCRT